MNQSRRERYRQALRDGKCGHCLSRPKYKHFSQCEKCYFDPKRRAAAKARDALTFPTKCAFDGCPRVAGCRHTFCRAHEQQKRRGQEMTQLAPANNLKHRPVWSQEKRDELARLYHAGKTTLEIGKLMGYPETTIKSRLARYREQLTNSRMAEGLVNRPLTPYPGVERCRCGLTLDKDHQTCDLPTVYQLAGSRKGDSFGLLGAP